METALDYWTFFREQFPFLLSLTINLLSALLIFVVGIIVGRWIRKRIRKSTVGGDHLDATLKPVIASVFFYLIIAMTLYAVLIKLGVPPTSLIAVFGGAALAIGLALKDTLSNIAAGIMLLFLRPLEVSEYVDISGISGTVIEIGLFATTLKTPEGIYQYVPNSKIWDSRIQNFGRHTMRQFRLDIGVSYDTDLRQAQNVMMETLLSAPERIIQNAPSGAEVFVMSFGDSAVDFHCRVWLPSHNWMERTSELRIEIFEALRKANIDMPLPQSVITMKRD